MNNEDLTPLGRCEMVRNSDRKNNQWDIDRMESEYERIRQLLTSLVPHKLQDWTIRSEADIGEVLMETWSLMADILSYYQNRIIEEAYLVTARERRSLTRFLRLVGYELAPATAASAMLNIFVANDVKGNIKVTKGCTFCTESEKSRRGMVFEYLGDDLEVNIDAQQKDSGGRGYKKCACIRVEQGESAKSELLGTSNGLPNQSYTLTKTHVIKKSLKLQIEKSARDIERWEERNNLILSKQNDRHFFSLTGEDDHTAVCFGDGQHHGMIPPSGASIKATYRCGGGICGNVEEGSITLIKHAPSLQEKKARVSNESPASGGKDRESIEHAIKYALTIFGSFTKATVEKSEDNSADAG